MSGYNDTFDLNAIAGAHGTPDPLNAATAPVMDQSGTWTAAPPARSGLMEGGTAASLHARLDFAPFGGARSNARDQWCTGCGKAYATASALDEHAKEATHQAYKCKCGTGFSNNSALNRHIDTKNAPKSFACPLCEQRFDRKDKPKDHCRLHHKVTGEWLQALFSSRGSRPRAAASRRREALVPLAAAPPGPAPAQAPAPALAVAPAGPSFWPSPACTGQQLANLPADPFILPGPFAPDSSFDWAAPFVPAADAHTAAPVTTEGISGTFDIFGDDFWATGFDGFDF